MGIGQPGEYQRLMGRLPHGHFDVVIPVELKDPDPTDEQIRRVRTLIHDLPKKHGLRKAVTWDRAKGDGCFILRVIGPQESIDALREELSTVTL